jgi:hypothetical protein
LSLLKQFMVGKEMNGIIPSLLLGSPINDTYLDMMDDGCNNHSIGGTVRQLYSLLHNVQPHIPAPLVRSNHYHASMLSSPQSTAPGMSRITSANGNGSIGRTAGRQYATSPLPSTSIVVGTLAGHHPHTDIFSTPPSSSTTTTLATTASSSASSSSNTSVEGQPGAAASPAVTTTTAAEPAETDATIAEMPLLDKAPTLTSELSVGGNHQLVFQSLSPHHNDINDGDTSTIDKTTSPPPSSSLIPVVLSPPPTASLPSPLSADLELLSRYHFAVPPSPLDTAPHIEVILLALLFDNCFSCMYVCMDGCMYVCISII